MDSEDRIQKQIEFIIEQQAQFNSGIMQLRGVQATTENVLGRLAAATAAGFQELGDKISALVDAQMKTEERVSSVSERVSSFTEEMSSLTEKVSSLTEKMSSLTEKMSSLTDKVSNLTGEVSSLTKKMSGLADAQALTDKHLNVLMDIVNKGRNGQS